MTNKKKVDNGHRRHNLRQTQKVLTMLTGAEQRRRHKCSICGRVRIQRYMELLRRDNGRKVKTRYGN